jgi:hypothetical protein
MLIKRLFNEMLEKLGLTRPGAASSERGTCRQCRHANHGTLDADDGLWACPWLGATDPHSPCRIYFKDSGAPVFERYDGKNGTWGTGDPLWRSVPQGYEGREVVAFPEPPEGG